MTTLLDLYDAYVLEIATQKPGMAYQRRIFRGILQRAFGALPLETLTPEHVRTWKAELLCQWQPGTVRTYLKRLHAVLHCGVALGWLSHDPMAHVRKPAAPPGRVRFLSADERARLLAACQRSRNPALYPVVVLALGTGGRKNEIRTLQWSQIDGERQVVRFLRTKTDMDRAVPLVGDAWAVVQGMGCARHGNDAWVFPRRHGTGPAPIESAWVTARAKAAIEDLHFHDLRHTYASYLAMTGATLREIAELLGHRHVQTTMIYAHLMPSHMRGVVERMHEKFLA